MPASEEIYIGSDEFGLEISGYGRTGKHSLRVDLMVYVCNALLYFVNSFILTEPTVLVLFCSFFLRVKTRCYNIEPRLRLY